MRKLRVIALLLPGMLSACTTIMVDPTADIPTVSYRTEVAPIIAANCAQSGCHGATDSRKFNLGSYSALSGLVEPTKPHNSELYSVIREYGPSAMPPAPNKPLSDEQIGQIYVWILQGALDN